MFGSKINPSGAAADLGDEIANSLRLNDDDSAYVTKTYSSGSDQTTMWGSIWFKRGNLSTTQGLMGAYQNGSNVFMVYLNTADNLLVQAYDAASFTTNMVTNAKLRDTTGWYHMYWQVNTTNGDSSIWLNGVEQSLSTSVKDSTSDTYIFGGAHEHFVGAIKNTTPTVFPFDGYIAMAQFGFGVTQAATDFGRYSTSHTNTWVPVNASGVTYGANGVLLDFAVAPGTGNGAGTDTSGNANHFTDTNLAAPDQLTDTPTNVFPTLSQLTATDGADMTLSNGNLRAATTVDQRTLFAPFGVTSGAYYFEVEVVSYATGGGSWVGVADGGFVNDNNFTSAAEISSGVAMNTYNADYYDDAATTDTTALTGTNVFATNDVIGIAVDFDNGLFWFAKNNTWADSVTPSVGGSGSTSLTWKTGSGPWFPFISRGGSFNETYEFRFQSGSWSYSAPTGFSELCQANLPNVVDDLGGADKPSESVQLITASGDNIVSDLDAALASGSFLKIYKNIDTGSTAWKWVFPDDTGNMWDSSVNTGKTTYSAPSGSDTFAGIGIKIATSVGTATSEVSHTSGSSTNYAHGLGVTPAFVILFPNLTANKRVFHSALDSGKLVRLDDQQAQATDSSFTVDATNVTISSSLASGDYRILAFAQIDGFSSFKFHDSNSNANGPFLYHGFSPLFEITVDIDLTDNALDWDLFSYKLESHSGNVLNLKIALNEQNAKSASGYSGVLDHVATGSKTRTSGSVYNTSSRHHARVAFAQAAIGGGIPFPNSR